MQQVDVVIIGASISGSALACFLASQNLSVTIIEQSKLLRTKPCGEGLSLRAVETLSLYGVEPELLVPEAPRLNGYRIVRRNRETKFICPAHPLKGFGVNRDSFDRALRNKALEEPQVKLVTGKRAQITSVGENHCTVTAGAETLKASFVVIANGPRFLSRKSNCNYGSSIKMQTAKKDICEGLVTIFIKDDCSIFMTPVGTDCVTVSVLGKKNAIKRFSSEAGLEHLTTYISEFTGSALFPCSEVTGAVIEGKASIPCYKNRVFVIGDALETLDPAGGLGMTLAIQSAHHLAEAFKKDTPENVSKEYLHRIQSELSLLRGSTFYSSGYLNLSRRSPLLFTAPLRFVGARTSCCLSSKEHPFWNPSTLISLTGNHLEPVRSTHPFLRNTDLYTQSPSNINLSVAGRH